MAYQMKHRPYLVGGLALGLGYAWSMVGVQNSVTIGIGRICAVIEQMYRLTKFLVSKSRVTAK